MITEPTGKFVLKIDQESSIEQKNEYILTSVKIKDAFYKLENAVPIELDNENDYYIAYNNDLKLLSSESALKETIDGIMDQFEDQWLEYVEVDEDTLSKSGNKLRNELLKTVGKRHVEL